MIRVWVKGPPSLDLGTLKKAFAERDITIATKLDESPCHYYVLIYPGKDIEELFEQLEPLEGVSGKVWVMMPTSLDCKILKEEGVSRTLQPLSWNIHGITERLLADLACKLPYEKLCFGGLYGVSKAMRELYNRIEKIASLRDPALILGETGTGKGMVAREIHRASGRPGEMLKVNSAEFRTDLLESELFGHVRGSFTGAHSNRNGLIIEAKQGSFFLDEIGEMALTSQAKLLAVIEDRKVRPLGANQFENVEARLIFATNRDLHKEIADGQFREDLYQRLRIFVLNLPPLRERRTDILLLAEHFLRAFEEETGRTLQLADEARDALFAHYWKGNVREVRSVIYQTAGFSDGNKMSTGVLLDCLKEAPPALSTEVAFPFDPLNMSWDEVQGHLKAAYFRKLIAHTSTKKEALGIAGLSRARFYEILKELDG